MLGLIYDTFHFPVMPPMIRNNGACPQSVFAGPSESLPKHWTLSHLTLNPILEIYVSVYNVIWHF